jgi:hypothetical protein
MTLSPRELREQSVALAAHSRKLRLNAEAARLRSTECRNRAQSAQHVGVDSRAHSVAAQQRQDGRSKGEP